MAHHFDHFIWGSAEEQTPEHGKEIPATLKSEEELAKFTVDEHLNEVERTVLFLNGGQPIQQRHAIVNLPSVIKGRARQAWDSIAGPLKTALTRLDAECQIEAADVFAFITKERLMSPADLQACLLPTVIRNIQKEKSEEETEAWLQALFELIPVLDKETLKSEVMSMALSKGDVEENPNSRVICARILGAIAPFLTKEEVERGFMKKAMAMCQDVDYTVRKAMSEQLAALGRTVGREGVVRGLLDELLELCKDEEVQVRAAAFTVLVGVLDMLPPDVRRTRVMPLLREHMQPFELDLVMQRCIARLFGQLLLLVRSEMEPDDYQMFYGCYKHMASKPDVELRRACAGSLGSLLKAATLTQANALGQHFSDTLASLAGDSDEGVRLAVAGQFHEVARYSGRDQCGPLLGRPLVRLLRDESPKVQAAVLPMLTVTLQQFVGGPESTAEPKRDPHLEDVVKALVDLEASAQRNWRLQNSLAAAFPSFHRIFTSDQVYDQFVPMAFRFLSNSAAAVRPAAAEGIVCFLRYNRREKQRAELFLRLIREYARGRTFTARLAFSDVCRHVVKRFSSRFIKDWMFDLCLELLYDPVPNVRLQVTSLLPVLKQAIKLPEDVDLLERLNNAISNSMTDNDRDVSVTARQINDVYKRTPVRMGGSVGFTDASGGSMAAYEAEDKRKEEEEADFGFTPEDAKEIKAEIVQLNYKRRAGGADGPGVKSAVARRSEPAAAARPGTFGVGRAVSGGATTLTKPVLASKADDGPGLRPSPMSSRTTGSSPTTAAAAAATRTGPTALTTSSSSNARRSESGGKVVGAGPALSAVGRPPASSPAVSRPSSTASTTSATSASSSASSTTPKLPTITSRPGAASSSITASARVGVGAASATKSTVTSTAASRTVASTAARPGLAGRK